ncbi:hypothetical protein BDF22DRAFT_376577 [Syncephalis plumigaleata]|nr:hypothetical protein BDF22DRAFT_376577 [Syncephalis plumigaleata]
MLLRLDTFLATTTAILMATSNIVDVTAAVPNCGIGPGVTRGLSIYPETIFGEAALGSLNGKEFSFHYVENVSDEWSESHGARSDKARLKFYKDCVKHQAANDVEREGRKVLECPLPLACISTGPVMPFHFTQRQTLK